MTHLHELVPCLVPGLTSLEPLGQKSYSVMLKLAVEVVIPQLLNLRETITKKLKKSGRIDVGRNAVVSYNRYSWIFSFRSTIIYKQWASFALEILTSSSTYDLWCSRLTSEYNVLLWARPCRQRDTKQLAKRWISWRQLALNGLKHFTKINLRKSIIDTCAPCTAQSSAKFWASKSKIW